MLFQFSLPLERVYDVAVLIYEPQNTEALRFQPLIEEKIALGIRFLDVY